VLPTDLALRNATYASFVDRGSAPSAADVAATTGTTRAEVLDAWRRLHAAHALVLDATGRNLRMANPFSAVPTPFGVVAAGRRWFANCAWDAFGICAALHADGRIETTCPDCGDPLTIAVTDGEPDDESLLFHCLVPARLWWEDIVFT
jgi:Alkylmercury lyase